MPKIKSEISAWFDYPDDPYGGRVLVRLVKGGEMEMIRERTTRLEKSYVQEFRKSDMSVSIMGQKEAIAIAATKNWENFFDEKDKPMDCNRDNIKEMCKQDGFFEFIDTCQAILKKQEEEKQEAESKN